MRSNRRITLTAFALLLAALPLSGCSLFRRDPGTSIRWIEGRTGEAPIDLRELARQLLEPPVLDPPERPRLRDFIVA